MGMSRKASDRLNLLLMFTVGVGVCCVPASARRAPAAPATGTFNHMNFSNTNGRVGYHMFAAFGVPTWDEPTGDNATCHPGAGDWIVAGTVPPGLALQQVPYGYGFDGTPRQPGDWTVNVTIGHIQCKEGPNQTDYGPRTVSVHFHIDP
jgi:hypothetical protein